MNTSDKRIWLFDLLRRHPEGLTREEIGEEYYRAGFPTSSVTLKDGRSRNEIPRETFNRVKRDLKEKYGVEVVCNPSTYTYCLEPGYEDKIDKATLGLFDSYQIIQNVRDNDQLRKKVMIDENQLTGANLQKVIKAMSECRTITLPSSWVVASIEWCDFTWVICSSLTFIPYGLRNYEGKWYMAGVFDDDSINALWELADSYDERHNVKTANNELKNRPFWVIEVLEDPLDYLSEEDALYDDPIELSQPNQYNLPQWFDINQIYKDFVGPDIEYNSRKIVIKIKANPRAAIRLNANPIHHSQDIYKEEPGATYYVLYLRPSKYFYRELKKYEDSIEIIEPQDLKEAYESVR